MISLIETVVVLVMIVPLDIKCELPLNSFTHAYPDVTNGRFEATSESKVKNAKQIVLYALGFLGFCQKLSGKIFNILHLCMFPCFVDVGVIKAVNDGYFHLLPPSADKLGNGAGNRFGLLQQQKVSRTRQVDNPD